MGFKVVNWLAGIEALAKDPLIPNHLGADLLQLVDEARAVAGHVDDVVHAAHDLVAALLSEMIPRSEYNELEEKYKNTIMLIEDQMIPRPDAARAKKAVDDFQTAVEQVCLLDWDEQHIIQTRGVLLRLMGVEVK